MDGPSPYFWLYLGAAIAAAFILYTWLVMALSAYLTTINLLRRIIAKRRRIIHERYLRQWRAVRFDIDDAKL